MAKIPYLIRRKNVFYFRLGIPAAFREIVKSREIIKSLKTEDSEEATRRALKLAAHFKALLHDLKTPIIFCEKCLLFSLPRSRA
jgi:hypothetical protein